MSNKINILAGPIQTGKTSALIKWSSGRDDVFGVLTPVIKNKRYFLDAHFRNQFEMEAQSDEQEVLSVGRFRFSQSAFERATLIINSSINKGWLVIDEIGPLELSKRGFYQPITNVLKNHFSPILFVVREGLLEKAVEFFRLPDYKLVSKEKLEQL